MLTKRQLTILGVFKKDLFASLTFKQIKEESKQKSNNIVQIALREFKEQGLVKTKIIGDVTTYFLNFDNNPTLSYLNLINVLEIQRRKFPKEILAEVQKRISKQTNFFILSVFGSYAQNKATEKSDLDMAVIVESEPIKKEIAPLLETVKRREIKPIDYHIFTRNEFLEMLKADYENVGKQIYKSNIIYYGFIEYCNMMRGRRNE
ncbi:MAG TPA: nucleotidyltransferase domain-containing protein [Candidatus Nanoarchaeia archaeon]|nr:nucleotidyltransferase domain-containing protein [Candidatus Nanoarchaeia archaeon]